MVVGYADDHSLLKIIPDKTDHVAAASDLNCDLAALYHFGGQSWQIKFAPNKTFSLIISLKRDLQLLPHPPLFLDGSVIPETSTVRVLGFTLNFDSLLTWEPHIVYILNRGKQRASQLYCCRGNLQNYCPLFRGAENTHRQSTVCMPGILLRICALLIQLISEPSIGFDVVGRLWRSTFGILSHRTYF